MTISTYLAAVLIHYFKDWSIPFYVFGAVNVLWSILFVTPFKFDYFIFHSFNYSFFSGSNQYRLCFNYPESHPHISDEEKNYIQTEMNGGKESAMGQKSIPWRAILTNRPVIAYILAMVILCFFFFLFGTVFEIVE